MKNLFYSVMILCLALTLSQCANYYHQRANEEYKTWNYAKAIRDYNRALEAKGFSGDQEKLALSYYHVNNDEKAIEHFALAAQSNELSEEGLFSYGTVLMKCGKHREASEILAQYLRLKPNDDLAKMLLNGCESITERYIDTTLFTLTKIHTPHLNSVFGAAPFHQGIVVVADKNAEKFNKKNPWNGATFLDFYFIQKNEKGIWDEPQVMRSLDGPYHEGPATFTKDQNTIYFTRSCYGRKGLSKGNDNVSNLSIYTSTIEDGMWNTPKPLPFNNENYSCGHPALTPDGETLYFISDMPGGRGGTDIYYSRRINNEWSKPVNAGRVINTPGNEMFPYIHSDGTMYFSSNGHNSMGGLDIFKSTPNGSKWSDPENMNVPVNSSADDFSYVLLADNSTGFLTSSRSGHKDELYTFTINPPTFILEGTARFKGTQKPVEDAFVTLLENETGARVEVRTNEEGKFRIPLDPEKTYAMKCMKKGYDPVEQNYSTVGKKISETFYAFYEIEEKTENVPEINRPIVLNNILFEFNKWELPSEAKPELERIVEMMKENPNFEIELSAHTDHRGSDRYNLELSQKRASSVVEYIISRGVSSERIIARGYGENKPIIDCRKNNCTDEELLANRRIEFIITKK